MKKICIIKLCLLCCIALAMLACSENLFGSSSNGSNCGNDIECLRISAEEMFRKADFKGSYGAYKKIVDIEPTASVGYFGMAKAGMWAWEVNPFTIIGLANTKEDEYGNRQIPFMGDTVRGRTNRYYKAMQAMYFPLQDLDHRDSLTAIWELYSIRKKDGDNAVKNYAKNIIKAIGEDTLFKRLDNFGIGYCQNSAPENCRDTTTIAKTFGKSFPLSDRKFKRSSYVAGYSIANMLYQILSFLDLNGDNCITTKNNMPSDAERYSEWGWGCSREQTGKSKDDTYYMFERDEEGNLTIDLGEAYNDLLDDPGMAEDLNSNLDSLYSGLLDVGNLINTISGSDLWEGGDEIFGDNPISDIQNELNDRINEYRDYLLFYKLNDGIDNDGDGCLDEGLAGYDTDGDGLKGEDMRIISLDPENKNSIPGKPRWKPCEGESTIGVTELGEIKTYNLKYCIDAEDNYTLYKKEDFNPLEMSGYVMYIATKLSVPPVREDTIVKLKFADKNFNPGYETSSDIDLKLDVQMETTKCYGLEKRIELIGGCWVNYTEDDFIEYRKTMKKEFANRNPKCDNIY